MREKCCSALGKRLGSERDPGFRGTEPFYAYTRATGWQTSSFKAHVSKRHVETVVFIAAAARFSVFKETEFMTVPFFFTLLAVYYSVSHGGAILGPALDRVRKTDNETAIPVVSSPLVLVRNKGIVFSNVLCETGRSVYRSDGKLKF